MHITERRAGDVTILELEGRLILGEEGELPLRDWVNRLRLLFSHKHIDLVAACWYNNQVFDSSNYVTASASASYSHIKLLEHVSMNLGVTGLLVAHSSDTQACPAKNGVYVTLAAVFD